MLGTLKEGRVTAGPWVDFNGGRGEDRNPTALKEGAEGDEVVAEFGGGPEG